MAAPQQEIDFPESRLLSLEEVEAAMVETEQRFIRLYQRYTELSGTTDASDKRKAFNPIRDLKISANRCYQWARRAGCDANEASDRAIAATKESAETANEQENILGKLLMRLHKKFPGRSTKIEIPESVITYIDQLHMEYNLTDAEKKAAKLKTKNAAKN